MPIGLRVPTHDSSCRVIAMTVAQELRSGEGRLGINSAFRLHSEWKAHGFYGMQGSERLKEICLVAFGPHDAKDAPAFVRGARVAAGIVVDGETKGSHEDLVVFWSAMQRLGNEMGVDMPSVPQGPDLHSGPRLLGH